jgi:hypothetical protein
MQTTELILLIVVLTQAIGMIVVASQLISFQRWFAFINRHLPDEAPRISIQPTESESLTIPQAVSVLQDPPPDRAEVSEEVSSTSILTSCESSLMTQQISVLSQPYSVLSQNLSTSHLSVWPRLGINCIYCDALLTISGTEITDEGSFIKKVCPECRYQYRGPL